MNPLIKLNQRIDSTNSLVCVGLDAEFDKLPSQFRDKTNPQFEFNKWIIDQTHEHVCAYKPNTAFYEARGEQGWRELRLTIEYLREHHPDTFTICDAKRADIGNTNKGYITAIFDDLGFDAVTLHPYLGREALTPFLERSDKVSIILCKTSNPNSDEFQGQPIQSRDGGQELYQFVAERVSCDWNKHNNCMLVVGATYPNQLRQVRSIVGDMPLLIPGIGAQGGDIAASVSAGKDSQNRGMIISSSRGIIFSSDPRAKAKSLKNSINISLKK